VVVNDSQVLAIHATLLQTGEILYFGGDEHSQAQHDANNIDHTRLFRLNDNAILPMTSPTTDVFCSGHARLADGRLLVGGGTEEWSGEVGFHDHVLGFPGLRSAWIYQPHARSWFRAADMNPQPGHEMANTGGGRWYPMLLTLGSGEVLAIFGHPNATDTRHRNNNTERYSPAVNNWFRLPEVAEAVAITYFDHFLNFCRVHLLNDGRVFFVTSVNGNRFFDTATGTFGGAVITAPTDPVYVDWHCQSVLLPLLPGDSYRPRILLTGDQTPRRIDLGDATPAWAATSARQGTAAGKFRKFGLSVLLPNGKVFVTGGVNSASDSSDALGVLEAEIYDPGIDWVAGSYTAAGTDSWATVESATVVRNYHSTALLMPDGRVWTAGSSKNAAAGDPAAVAEHRIEIYSPDYVGAVGRPTITTVPDLVSYGETFRIDTPDAGIIRRVAMMRCGSVTHAGDHDQRYVALSFTPDGPNALNATAPPSSNVAPPGYYMLWIIDQNGLPCANASFIRLTSLACFIITDRSTFSVLEVDAFLDTGVSAHFDSAFFVVFDGYMPHEIGDPIPNPTIEFAFDMIGGDPVDGMFIDPLPVSPEDASLPPDIAQRFTWPFTIRFTNHNAFNAFMDTRSVTIRATLGTRSCTASVELMKQPNPYMIDGDPYWLSTDVRVFRVNGGADYQGIHQDSGGDAGSTFINNFVNACRMAPDDNTNPFAHIETDETLSELDLATNDSTVAGNPPIFNYAVARVRYRASTTPADNVRVFFRAFNVEATSLEYHHAPDQPYARVGDGAAAHPLLGTLGGELVSIPFFGQARVPDLATQDDILNTRSIAPAGAAESWEFYGAWLDFNRTTPLFSMHPVGTGPYPGGTPIQDLIRGKHMCLIAEVHFVPADPIPEFATPGSSDNLSQRNLAIAHSDNPGNEASHTVTHTFMVQPSMAPSSVSLGYEEFGEPFGFAEALRKRPRFGDELMIRWHNLPRDSRVTFYFSDVDADTILAKAGARLGPPILSKLDDHTIECRVAGDFAFIPIPGGRSTPIPGLVTIQLPDSVVSGDNYRVSVHQCSGLTRRVIGSFQLSVPVRKAETIVGEESRALSVLRRIALSIPTSDHWYPIFQRYLGGLADQVAGLGGDPGAIHPNRDGSGRPEPPESKGRHCWEGWGYAAMLACALVALGIAPAALAPLAAIAIIAAVGLVCRWWIRCRPTPCELLTMTFLALTVASMLVAIAGLAGGGKPWTWLFLTLLTIATAVSAIAVALHSCCGCEHEVPWQPVKEIGLIARRKPRPHKPSPTQKRRRLDDEKEVPAVADSPRQGSSPHSS
jgi:hypothetical protein